MVEADEFIKSLNYGIRQKAKEERIQKAEKNKILLQKKQTPQYQEKKLIQQYNIKRAKAIAKQNIEAQRRGYLQAQANKLAIQQAQAQRRQRIIGNVYSKAEQLEMWAVNLDEVPLLHALEYERKRQTTPPDRNMTRIIKETSDSFPS